MRMHLAESLRRMALPKEQLSAPMLVTNGMGDQTHGKD
jgi:hypothetical protein